MKSNIIILLNFKFSLIIIDFCDLNEAEMVWKGEKIHARCQRYFSSVKDVLGNGDKSLLCSPLSIMKIHWHAENKCC